MKSIRRLTDIPGIQAGMLVHQANVKRMHRHIPTKYDGDRLLEIAGWSRLLFCLLLSAVSCTAHSQAEEQHAPDRANRPNIIIILADDLGVGDIGVYGATRIRTPNIDALAASGLRFTNGYASANVCSPSRAGLLTGRYAIRSGLAWKVVTASSTHGLPPAEQTLAELATSVGYNTLYVGKWHLGRLPDHSPLKHGFTDFYGVPHSNDMADFALFQNNRIIEQPVDQSTLTRRYTEQAVEFIRRQQDAPFLLFMSHTFPHIPLFASEQFKGKSAAGLYGDTVEELDWSTGKLVNALRETGVLDDTLIFFTSDNGPFFEGSSGGLKGGKGTSWEAGYRVPYIFSWPRVIATGRSCDTMSMNIDLLPTLADILGISPTAETIDGRSLLPLFQGREQAPHEYLYFFNNENIVGIRSQRWKYVTHAYYTGSLGAFEKFDQLPGFQGSYQMLLDARGIDGESYSYADRYPEKLETLQKALSAARNEFDSLRSRPPEPTYPP